MVLENPDVHAQRAKLNKMIAFVLVLSNLGSDKTGGFNSNLDLKTLFHFDSSVIFL